MASILLRTLIVYILLTFSLKFMGKRQIGELEVGELVTTLLISEIAALPVADADIPLMSGIIPVLLIVSIEIVISKIKNRSEKLKKYIEGEPSFLVYQGQLRQDVLRENRISINEVLSEMRNQGIGDFDDIYYAILEQNGKLSILKKDGGANLAHPVIIDTEINFDKLNSLGYSEAWLNEILCARNIRKEDIFLLTVDDYGKIKIIKKD